MKYQGKTSPVTDHAECCWHKQTRLFYAYAHEHLEQFRLAASLVFSGFMSLYMTLNYYEAMTMKTQMIREVKQSSN